MAAAEISEERAGKVARSQPCAHCREYSFKKISLEPASKEHRRTLKAVWIAKRVCGVCGLDEELGIDGKGEIVYNG